MKPQSGKEVKSSEDIDLVRNAHPKYNHSSFFRRHRVRSGTSNYPPGKFFPVNHSLLTASLLLFVLLGCDRDPMVRVYDAPKDPIKTPPPRMAQVQGPTRFLIAVVPVGDQVYFLKASDRPEKLDGLEPALKEIATAMKAGESGEIDWGLPEGWLKKPGTGPVVSAVLQSPVESGSVNFTVTQLSGPPNPDAWDNYLEVNINRWRGQLSLPPNTIAEQKPDLVKIDREGLESAWLVDLRTDDATSPPNPTPQQNTLPSDSPVRFQVTHHRLPPNPNTRHLKVGPMMAPRECESPPLS